MRKLIAALIVVTLGVLAFEVKYPDDRVEKLTAKCLPTVVAIKVTYLVPNQYTGLLQRGIVSGAGVLVTPEGHILTCAHLFNLPYKRVKIATVELYSGELAGGELLSIDKRHDLALVRAPAIKNNKYAYIADPRDLKLGQEVIVIGHPYGYEFSVTNGIISGLNRDFSFAYNMVQTNSVTNPGNSGGPVFNSKGEVVGIMSFIHSAIPFIAIPTGISFAVSSGQCLEFLVYNGKTISPHRRYRWLRKHNDAKK